MSDGTLVFVRHAESAWNASGRWQGWGDPPLSDLGRTQAQALAERLGDAGIRNIVTSDLTRAAETARILGEAIGITPRPDRRLRERDLGAWSGLTEDEIRARFPHEFTRFRARDVDVRPGGGESRRAFHARVGPVLSEIAAAAVGRVVVVTHLGVIRLLAPEQRPANTEMLAFPATLFREITDASSASNPERDGSGGTPWI